MREFKGLDLTKEAAGLEGRPSDHYAGRYGEEEKRETIAFGTLLDDASSHFLGALEACLVTGAVPHGEGAIEHEDAVGPLAARGGQSAPIDDGFRHGQHEEHDEEGSQSEQQPLLDVDPAAAVAHGCQQVLHGRPGHFAITPAAPEVDEEGRGGRCQPAEHRRADEFEGEQGRDGGHGRSSRRLELGGARDGATGTGVIPSV